MEPVTITAIIVILCGLAAATALIGVGAYLAGRWDQIKYWTLRK